MISGIRPNPITQTRRIKDAKILETSGVLELHFEDDGLPYCVAIPLIGQMVTVKLHDLDRSESMVAKYLPTLE